MGTREVSKILLFGVLSLGFVFLFQNCGPANLESGSSSTSTDKTSLIGTSVDIASLLAAAPENASNIIYPTSVNSEQSYSTNAPILQNIVLSNNDFSNILWVAESTGVVIGTGDTLQNGLMFSPQMAGVYLVVGYRGNVPYIIRQFTIDDRTSNSSSVSGGFAGFSQTVVSSDSVNESVLVQINAPMVDLASSQMFLREPGQLIIGHRAILVTKSLAETVHVDINLQDTAGNVLATTVTLAPQSAAPTPTPAPTPVPTPAPTPMVTPTPALAANVFSVSSPTNGSTVSGTITISGTAGSQWLNVVAYNSGNKLTNDVSPINGTYSLSLDTTILPNGLDTILVKGFSVAPGMSGGTSVSFTVQINVSN